MKLPLQITYRHIEPSPFLEARIRELASKLDRFSAHIMRCHVIVQASHHHHHRGVLFDCHLDITVPDAEIGIRRAHPGNHSHEDPYVALRDVFRAARRKLEDYESKRRRPVNTYVELPAGRIHELDSERSFGRIQTADGRLVYFHSTSVVGYRFEDLTTGIQVHFAEEGGNSGPQARTVHVIV